MISCASRAAAVSIDSARVEHQRDPGQRLHRAVVELDRETSSLVLLGGDDLLRESRALGLAHLRVLEQPAFSFSRAAKSARTVARATSARANGRCPDEMQRTDLLVAGAQRHDDPVLRRRTRAAARPGASSSRTRLEQLLRLLARPLEHRPCRRRCDPIDSMSASRKRAWLASSRSVASCRSRSATIRYAATTPAIAIVSASAASVERMAARLRSATTASNGREERRPGRASGSSR